MASGAAAAFSRRSLESVSPLKMRDSSSQDGHTFRGEIDRDPDIRKLDGLIYVVHANEIRRELR